MPSPPVTQPDPADDAVSRPESEQPPPHWHTPFHRMHLRLADLERQNDLLRRERQRQEEREARLGELGDLAELNRMVAHDLRQPLNVIYAYSQAILACCEELDENGRGYLQEILEGTARMNRFIGALVDFSRVGTIELRRVTVDLSELARGVVTRLEQGEPGRRVEVRIPAGITAQADYDLMAIVLDHLVRNAWKFTGSRPDPLIEFGVREAESGPVFQLRDNGVGVEPGQLETLFAPLNRGTGDRRLRGFGLGLATAQRIVQRHGGRIWAEGAPGAGLCINFTLAT